MPVYSAVVTPCKSAFRLGTYFVRHVAWNVASLSGLVYKPLHYLAVFFSRRQRQTGGEIVKLVLDVYNMYVGYASGHLFLVTFKEKKCCTQNVRHFYGDQCFTVYVVLMLWHWWLGDRKVDWVVVFTSHSTQNRSFRRRFPANLLAWYGKKLNLT